MCFIWYVCVHALVCVHACMCLLMCVYIFMTFFFFFLLSGLFAFVIVVCLIIWFLERERGWMVGEVERVLEELGENA